MRHESETMKTLSTDKDKLSITADEAVGRMGRAIRSTGFTVAEVEDAFRKIGVKLTDRRRLELIQEKPVARGYITKGLEFADRLFHSIDFLGCLQYISLFIALYGLWLFLVNLFRSLL